MGSRVFLVEQKSRVNEGPGDTVRRESGLSSGKLWKRQYERHIQILTGPRAFGCSRKPTSGHNWLYRLLVSRPPHPNTSGEAVT